MSNQHIAFVNLREMIESQKQQIVDVEHKNMEKADCMRELNELIKTATKIVRKETMLDKECQKGIYYLYSKAVVFIICIKLLFCDVLFYFF